MRVADINPGVASSSPTAFADLNGTAIFSAITAPANATADQKAHYSKAVEEAFLNTPERDITFQILFPPSVGAAFGFDGFGGMVVKPWEQRSRSVFEILPEVQGKLMQVPGLETYALKGGSHE